MALQIDPDRIASGDLTEYEEDYLRTRGKLPGQRRGGVVRIPLEDQSVPTIANRGGIDDEDEGEEDYEEGWNNDQRRAALSSRNLSVDGNKAELIGRLRRSDTGQLQEDDYSSLAD